MAFHCGAPTRDGSACQRHVREPGTRCPQHRNLGGTALHPPRHAMRTITLADPALTEAPTPWISARNNPATRAGELRDRVTRSPQEESEGGDAGSLGDGEAAATEDEKKAASTPVGRRSYLDRERAERSRRVREAEPGEAGAEAEAEKKAEAEAEAAAEQEAEVEVESRPVERPPLLRKERALDPDWIGSRPLFRDEAPTRPMARIEFEPSDGAEASASPKASRIAPLRSVVLNPQSDAASQAPVKADPGAQQTTLAPEPAPDPSPDSDPPTLIDRMPPIDPDDLVVPDFLRPDFEAESQPVRAPHTKPHTNLQTKPRPEPEPPLQPEPQLKTQPQPIRPPKPLPVRPPKPQSKPQPQPPLAPDPPTLDDPHPAVARNDVSVPDFIVPGFSEPAPKPPLRTVLSTVLGPELWQQCYAEWGAAHCIALARIARNVDGLAPSAGAAVRSTAGAGMRWLGVAREREVLADQVADAISHPAGATAANQARTVRLYGAAICMALNLPLRRCACHRDLERDVSGELIRLGLEELAGEVP